MTHAPSTSSATRLTILGVVLMLTACGDDAPSGPPAVSGLVTARLLSPNGAEAGAVIEVDAGPVQSVAGDSADAFDVPIGDRLRIVLVRAEPGEIRALLALRDTAAELNAAVLEVADSTNALRESVAGYDVAIVR